MSHTEKIVEQAMQIFIKQGIKAVRMDDIARQMGISKRTLYELFADKETLLYMAVERYFERCDERRTAMCADARNVLEAIFIGLSDVMAQSETTDRIMGNLRRFYPAVYGRMLREGAEKNRRGIREKLEQGVADGFFVPDFNLDLAITMLYHTASALVARRDLLLPEDMSDRKAFIQVMTTFFRGIATAKGLELIDRYKDRLESAEELP